MIKRLLFIAIISSLIVACAHLFSGQPMPSDNATIGEGTTANSVTQ